MSVPKLRFKEFSDDWEEKKLGDITLKVGSGSTPRGGVAVYQSFGIPFIRSQNVNNEQLMLDDITFISEKINNQMKGSVVKPDDILLNITGASIGRSCVVPLNFELGNVNQHVCIIRLKPDYAPRFLQPYLSSSRGQKSISSTQVGSGREGLNFEAIRSFNISIPSLPEQTKISNFLTAVDEKITLLTQKVDLLSQYKKGVMQQIFSQELRFKDDDGQEFPEWEEKTLGDVCICLDNQRKPLNDAERQTMQGEFPYWGANNIMDYVDDYLFDETIVLLAEDGGNFNEYKTRPIANISHGKCWVNNHTHVLKGEIGLSNEFLFYSLVHKNITGYVSGGTRAKLTKGEMLKIEISIPNPAEQTKIANFLTAIDEKITSNQTQLNAVKQYKQGLLQQMFV